MSHHRVLTFLSIAAMVLLAIHVADDYILGFDKGVVSHWYVITIWIVWLCGVVLWRDRLLGRIILLVGGIFALGMPIIHLNGRGYGEEFIKSGAALRFIWTLFALGAIGALLIILSIKEMVVARRERQIERIVPTGVPDGVPRDVPNGVKKA
jgi:hypothetical protein